MCDLLMKLIPVNHYYAGTKIWFELDDVNHILFVSNGKIGVGYDINKRERYPLELSGA